MARRRNARISKIKRKRNYLPFPAGNQRHSIQDLDNQNASVGCLAQMVVRLEAELKVAKQETQAAIKKLHECVETEIDDAVDTFDEIFDDFDDPEC